MERRCEHCGDRFIPRPNVPGQRYCSKIECQKARRKAWRKRKLSTDGDYRSDQQDAQKRWRENHRDYWRRYRAAHPLYVERNRVLQKERNHRRGGRVIAKSDASDDGSPMRSGYYRLMVVGGEGIAKSDEYLVKLDILSGSYPCPSSLCDCKQVT